MKTNIIYYQNDINLVNECYIAHKSVKEQDMSCFTFKDFPRLALFTPLKKLLTTKMTILNSAWAISLFRATYLICVTIPISKGIFYIAKEF